MNEGRASIRRERADLQKLDTCERIEEYISQAKGALNAVSRGAVGRSISLYSSDVF